MINRPEAWATFQQVNALEDIAKCQNKKIDDGALFEYCELHSKRDSYITAASTPQSEEFGYVFKN